MSSLRVFTVEEAELINVIGNTLIPEGGIPHYRFEDLVLDFEADTFFTYAHRDIRRAVRFFLKVIQYAPLFSRFKKFTSLTQKEREELLESWEKSRWAFKRQMITALKGFLMLLYYNHPLVKEKLGFRFRCDDEKG